MSTLKAWLRERGLHWQNLSDGDIKRPGWVHGRAWLRLVTGERKSWEPALQAEWSHGRLGLDATIRFNRDEREVTFHVAIPGASYYLTVEGVPKRLLDALPFKVRRTRYEYEGGHRSIGVQFHDGAMWISLWNDDHSWQSSDPKWWHMRFGLDDIADRIFGKTEYSTETIEEQDVEIPMYDGSHQAVAKRTLSKWTRPRWPWAPFSKQRIGVDIDIPNGIETNHKGPLFGMSLPAKSISDGIGAVVASVLRDRGRYHSTERDRGLVTEIGG